MIQRKLIKKINTRIKMTKIKDIVTVKTQERVFKRVRRGSTGVLVRAECRGGWLGVRGRLQDTLEEERVLDGLPQLVHRNKGKVSVLSNEL